MKKYTCIAYIIVVFILFIILFIASSYRAISLTGNFFIGTILAAIPYMIVFSISSFREPFRFYPIRRYITIDRHSVKQFNYRKKQASLEITLKDIHIYKTGQKLQYVIFANRPVAYWEVDTVYRKNEAIIFPLHDKMKADFPALFTLMKTLE